MMALCVEEKGSKKSEKGLQSDSDEGFDGKPIRFISFIVLPACTTQKILLPHQRIAEFEIFVEIVEAIKKITHVTSQHGQDTIVAVLTDEIDKVDAHLIHEFTFRDAQQLNVEEGRRFS